MHSGPVIWIPDVGTRTELYTPASQKTPPFWHPLILVAMSSWAQWWTPVVRGTKPLGHPAMVARGSRMYGEGQAAVIPGKMSLLRRQRLGDWQVATCSTEDHPVGPEVCKASYLEPCVGVEGVHTMIICAAVKARFQPAGGAASTWRWSILLQWFTVLHGDLSGPPEGRQIFQLNLTSCLKPPLLNDQVWVLTVLVCFYVQLHVESLLGWSYS